MGIALIIESQPGRNHCCVWLVTFLALSIQEKPCPVPVEARPPVIERRQPMLLLSKLYDHHAKDCVHQAGRTDNPKHREMLLKMAREWTRAAALRTSNAIEASAVGTR
jgi:hypothetical protein